MSMVRLAAVLLIVIGALALIYGGFKYTERTSEASLGPIELVVSEKHTVNVPVWMGVGAIVAGGALLLLKNRKS